jgi:hypothetical protein
MLPVGCPTTNRPPSKAAPGGIRHGEGYQEVAAAAEDATIALGELIHAQIRVAIEAAVHEELAVALGAGRYERRAKGRGYRNGVKTRTLTGPTGLTPAQRAQIQAVAMDMWEPYVQSVQAHVPQAGSKIVFDVFHILQHMNKAVDQVRRREHRLLRAQGDETLTGSKYVWLYGEENVPDRHWERFTELTRRRSRQPLKTARAWALKPARSVAVPDPCCGRRAVALVVRLGVARAAGPRGGADDQAAPAERADLLPAPDHQRHERGHRQPDPSAQEGGERLPEPGQLQDRDLLPLWGLDLYPDLTH